jgi:hypothetical protein
MSIYLTSSLPTPPPPTLLLTSGFESGFPPSSDCQKTNEYLHPTQSMKICVSVCVCVYVAFIFDMAVTILLLVNKDEEEKYI